MPAITLALWAVLQTAVAGVAEPPHWLRAVYVTDPTLRDAVVAVADASPTFRASLDSVASRNGVILLLTLENVWATDEKFAEEGIAEVAPVVQPDSTVSAVMVVLNLEGLRKTYARARLGEDVLKRDLQRIIIHEVYGHGVPYLLAGHVRGACPDPTEGQKTGCSVERENRIRTEAKLGKRKGYDLSGLELAARR